jgi:hypothetical protein
MAKLAYKIRKINESIAAACTTAIGTMWCVYLFVGLTMLPLFFPSIDREIQYISSAFLQLVFLPLIMVGQSVLNKESEKMAKEDHQMIMNELKEIREIRRLLEENRKGEL